MMRSFQKLFAVAVCYIAMGVGLAHAQPSSSSPSPTPAVTHTSSVSPGSAADRAWQETERIHAEWAYRSFVKKHPGNAHVADAKACAGRLAWQRARIMATPDAYQKFVDENPGDPHITEAHDILQHQDVTLADAVQRGWVRSTVTGAGLMDVSVSIKRLVPRPLRVSIPTGTYFVSGGGGSQNMVSRESLSADLTTSSSAEVSVSASCANFYREMPDQRDHFDVLAAHPNADLRKVLAVIGRRNPSVLVSQLAIWSCTDDPSREEVAGHINVVPSANDYRQAAGLLREAGVSPASRRMFYGIR